MIWVLVTVLLALWMGGTLTSHAPNGGAHMLLVLALIMVLATLLERSWRTT